jgi:hypothetical protein
MKTPTIADSSGETTTVRALLSGNFPGSPVEVDLTSTLSNDKIAALVIGLTIR